MFRRLKINAYTVATDTSCSKRIAAENKWYVLTGRVVEMKVEADGDVYLALQDAIGKLGSVVVEVPAKPKWCPILKVLFGLTKTKFPLSVQSAKTLKVDQAPGHHRYRKSVFRHWPRFQRSIKPENRPCRLRCLGNSCGDEGQNVKSLALPVYEVRFSQKSLVRRSDFHLRG
jgi:hypothetical protein